MRRTRTLGFACIVTVAIALTGGCPKIEDSDFTIDLSGLAAAISVIQDDDPREIVLPEQIIDNGDTIIIDNSVTVIVNPSVDIVVEELPDQLIVGFENLTGFDIYLKYLADGEEQGIFVFDGETLLLEYPCLAEIEMLSEDDIDPDTGVLIQSFDLFSIYEEGFDYECGDAFLITIDEDDVVGSVEAIDLLVEN